MSKSIEEYKKEAIFKRRAKTDPLGALQELFGGSMDSRVQGIFQKIIKDVVVEMFKNEDVLSQIVEMLYSELPEPQNGYTPVKGKDYKDGEDGYTPIKGIDYYTETERQQFVESIIDGYVPQKGRDYFTESEKNEFAAKILRLIPKPKDGVDGKSGKDGKDGTEIEGKDIVRKINEGEYKIDASKIKNLPTTSSKKSIGLARGGLKLVYNTQLEGLINGSNTVFTLPSSAPRPKDGKFIVSARGVLKDSDSGDFTVSSDNRTITFDSAPPEGSARPRVPIYEAH